MSDGIFVRLNAAMVKETNLGDGMIISVVGKMESTDGEVLHLRASDGTVLQYSIQPEFGFVQGKIVELMGAKNAETGAMDAFVARDLGEDFDIDLYNQFLTKVLHSGDGKYKGYFGQ